MKFLFTHSLPSPPRRPGHQGSVNTGKEVKASSRKDEFAGKSKAGELRKKRKEVTFICHTFNDE